MSFSVCDVSVSLRDDLDTALLEAAIWEHDSQSRSNSCQSSLLDKKVDALDAETDSKLSLIESAITLNRINGEKFKQLESLLLGRLEECRKYMGVVHLADPESCKKDCFQGCYYRNYGMPYFKDVNFMPAPLNSDSKIMKENGIINYYLLNPMTSWTVHDRGAALHIITEMSRKKMAEKLQSEIAKLNRIKKKTANIYEAISSLEERIQNVNSLSLNDCVLPIEEDYDWDAIANRLNYKHKPEEYASIWKLLLHPCINKTPLSNIEKAKLQKIIIKYNYQNWGAISKDLGTHRSEYQCFWYFKNNFVSNIIKGLSWTKEEDEFLSRLVHSHRVGNFIPWDKISTFMDNKTKGQMYNRWLNSIEPNIRKGKFLPEEDAVIAAAIKVFGLDFAKIASYLPGRTLRTIRSHYDISLSSYICVSWSVEEDEKLMRLMSFQGPQMYKNELNYFAVLANHFPYRNRHQIRRRYQTLRNWRIKHPHIDIKFAPRRHYDDEEKVTKQKAFMNLDLNSAYNALKAKLLEESNYCGDKGDKKVEDHSEVDEALTNYFAIQFIENKEIKEIQKKVQGSNKTKDVANLQKLLMLLRSNLDRSNFELSEHCSKYKELLACNGANIVKPVRTYSRKQSFDVIKIEPKQSVWSDSGVLEFKNVLPPNMSTLLACYACLLQTPLDIQEIKFSIYSYIPLQRIAIQKLMERFESLFTWPLHISNYFEVVSPDLFEGNKMASSSVTEPVIICDEPQLINFSQIRDAKSINNVPENKEGQWPIDLPYINEKALHISSNLKVIKNLDGMITEISHHKKSIKRLYPAEWSRIRRKKRKQS